MKDRTSVQLSADIGGTFTDVVLEVDNGRITRKVLTTPDQPEIGMLRGLELALGEAGLQFCDVGRFVHGTTLATNAIIERRGAKTALLATEGFRDVLEIATESRFNQYDLMIEKPRPLIEREDRFTVAERILSTGSISIPLDEQALRNVADEIRTRGFEAVAIAFLHAYANPTHELRARDILRESLGGVSISLSHQVSPEAREYERTSTTAANAYVQPLMKGYLGRMASGLQERGFVGATYLMASSGGLTSLAVAQEFPVRLVESGPAGGAIFAARIAVQCGEDNILSYDMGGTTAKICFIEKGQPTSSRFFEVDRSERFMKGSGLPLKIPVIEMVEIGAGGGSIAQVDSMKRINVGPRSVSSKPGPACYALGGDVPSVTDADLVLGLIAPEGFANGTMTLRADLAADALSREVSSKLDISLQEAAFGVYEVVCESMANAARMHAAELGVALEHSTMIAFGGAAPLHAARVAEKIGIKKVIVPANAGVGSAVGFLAAPISYEIVRSFPQRIDNGLDGTVLHSLLTDMAREARLLVEPGAGGAPLFEKFVAFMRYVGQGHEVAVEIALKELLQSECVTRLRSRFEGEYLKQFSRVIPNAAIEVLNWSALVSTFFEHPVRAPEIQSVFSPSPKSRRRIYHERSGASFDVPVYERSAFLPGARVVGPALITEIETAIFVTGAFGAYSNGTGCVVLERNN